MLSTCCKAITWSLWEMCPVVMKFFFFSATNSCRLKGEASCPISDFSCALNDSSTETLNRKFFHFLICDIAEPNSTQASSRENACFLPRISHQVSSFIQKLCEMCLRFQH